jgi:hypothetical protein
LSDLPSIHLVHAERIVDPEGLPFEKHLLEPFPLP